MYTVHVAVFYSKDYDFTGAIDRGYFVLIVVIKRHMNHYDCGYALYKLLVFNSRALEIILCYHSIRDFEDLLVTIQRSINVVVLVHK